MIKLKERILSRIAVAETMNECRNLNMFDYFKTIIEFDYINASYKEIKFECTRYFYHRDSLLNKVIILLLKVPFVWNFRHDID